MQFIVCCRHIKSSEVNNIESWFGKMDLRHFHAAQYHVRQPQSWVPLNHFCQKSDNHGEELSLEMDNIKPFLKRRILDFSKL